VLESAGVQLQEVDLLAVAAGPGSFTGLRVGIAAIQGLAVATDRRVVPVSALDALARAGRDGPGLVAAWMDAQRGQVFAALYRADGHPLVAPSALSPAETLKVWGADVRSPQPVRFIGGGAARYADLIRAELGNSATIADSPPLAGIIGLIAAAHPERAVSPHAVVPIYVRRPDAELARLQRTSQG
jgi:tRNA threonylcarbamoyladenosine biosynthesis protein TsaB